MSSHFETLLRNACLTTDAAAVSTKLVPVMPERYTELRGGDKHRQSSASALSRFDSDSIPERIEGAIAPHFVVPGRLIKVHLPDADIRYFSQLFSDQQVKEYLRKLTSDKHSSKWDKLGKGRLVAQWSRPGGIKYVFSDDEYIAKSFPEFVEEIRLKVIEILSPIYGKSMTDFNYCVCNCYLNGSAGVNWHTDAEPHLVPGYPIACVSFGSGRVFSLARIPRIVSEPVRSELNLRLESGSLLVMAGDTQSHFLHAIAKEASVKNVRFSLTFRVNFIHPPSL